jgi:hypothetical protein
MGVQKEGDHASALTLIVSKLDHVLRLLLSPRRMDRDALPRAFGGRLRNSLIEELDVEWREILRCGRPPAGRALPIPLNNIAHAAFGHELDVGLWDIRIINPLHPPTRNTVLNAAPFTALGPALWSVNSSSAAVASSGVRLRSAAIGRPSRPCLISGGVPSSHPRRALRIGGGSSDAVAG